MIKENGDLQIIPKIGNTDAERPLTVDEVLAKSRLIREVVERVMKEGRHYGTIPGCGKKACLFQAGAQQLGVTFNLCANPVILNAISTPDEYSTTIRIDLCSSSGVCVASALGRASSMEEKYHWRKAVCAEEFNETPENKRRTKWKKGWNGEAATKEQQIIVNPDDIANTVLKMSFKRAYVGAIINATAASDQFTQDIEDMQKELLRDEETGSGEGKKEEGVRERPKNDRQPIVKKIMTAIKKICENDAKKIADMLKSNFPKGINDSTVEVLDRMLQKLESQSQKVSNVEQPTTILPESQGQYQKEVDAKEKDAAFFQEQEKNLASQNENGNKIEILAKIFNSLKIEEIDEHSYSNYLIEKYGIAGLTEMSIQIFDEQKQILANIAGNKDIKKQFKQKLLELMAGN